MGWDTEPSKVGGNGWNGGTTEDANKWDQNGDQFKSDTITDGNMNSGLGGAGVQSVEEYGDNTVERSNACHNCGQEGHLARECPEPKKMGACFNCGEEGHTKAECTKPRVFKGTCNLCSKEGHRAAECPDKPPPTCKNCRKQGHETKDCKDQREFDLNHIADKTVDEALALLQAASEDRDLDDFKEAFKVWTKADRSVTYEQAELKLREMNLSFYIIALAKEPGTTFTNVDLQGNIDREFAVGFFLSPKPQRPKIKERWPETPEENLERLKNAGQPMDRGVPLCARCGELGHMARQCSQDAGSVMVERVEVKCVNCDEPGHRARDCTKARSFGKPRECKVCGSTEHMAKECDQREAMKCRNCNQEGHKAADCDQPRAPRDPATIQCRNCDEFGHTGRECPKPRDYSRVTCKNCGKTGHTQVRCREPPNENAGPTGFENDTSFNNDNSVGETGGFENIPVPAAPVTADTGGW